MGPGLSGRLVHSSGRNFVSTQVISSRAGHTSGPYIPRILLLLLYDHQDELMAKLNPEIHPSSSQVHRSLNCPTGRSERLAPAVKEDGNPLFVDLFRIPHGLAGGSCLIHPLSIRAEEGDSIPSFPAPFLFSPSSFPIDPIK